MERDAQAKDTGPARCPVNHQLLPGRGAVMPTVDIDATSSEWSADPIGLFHSFREQSALVWSTANGGHWIATTYDAVTDAVRDTDTFTNTRGPTLRETDGGEHGEYVPKPTGTDPPDTKEYRKVTLKAMSPAAADRYEPRIRAVANELIDEFIEAGQADLMAQILLPLPAQIVLEVLGFDSSQWASWVELVHQVTRGEDSDIVTAAMAETFGRVHAAIAERQQNPQHHGDVIEMIMEGKVFGQPMSVEDQGKYIWLILAGGMDTTAGATANALVQVAGDAVARDRLVKERGSLRHATDELLRIATSVHSVTRGVTRDVEFHGQQLKAGDRILISFGAANLDPGEFEQPDSIDLERFPNRHLTFSAGAHRCLGANYAKTMFEVMLDEIFARLPDFEISADLRYSQNSSMMYSPISLPVTFTPGKRVAAPSAKFAGTAQ